MIRMIVLFGALAFIAGCARHVVVKPEEVGKHATTDWEVKSQPGE